MSHSRRRKCRNCRELFRADLRNVRHQRYCAKPQCRGASKAASQQRWLAKAANRDYFHGPAHGQRVRAWRAAHPGYWRPFGRALQEHSSTQSTETQRQSGLLVDSPLQELSRAQPLILMGLIAQLTCVTRRHRPHRLTSGSMATISTSSARAGGISGWRKGDANLAHLCPGHSKLARHCERLSTSQARFSSRCSAMCL